MGLFVSNAPSAKFARIGDSVAGEIVDVYRSQRYEYVRGGQGQPLYWQDRKPVAGARINRESGKPNDPVLQWVITLDTGVPNGNGETERRLFVKNKRMETALTAAVAAAGGRRAGGLLIGGRLRCTWVGEEQGDGPQPAHVHEFAYAPPAPGTGREPSGEVRLVEREDEPVTHVQPALATGYAAPPTYADRLAVGEPEPGHRVNVFADGRAEHAATASARRGVRDTDVTRAPVSRPLADDDEPPF